MDNRVDPVLQTLLYSDIFDYPLKKEEIWRYLISRKKISKKEVAAFIKSNKNEHKIENMNGYYFIKGRKNIVDQRREREKESLKKIRKAKKIIKIASVIPGIRFIGISGALSMKNSGKLDDIDIFVITKRNLTWSTRFFLVVLLSFLGVYRKRNSKSYSDKICLNMVLDENHIGFGKNNQNLYTAHEIIQLLPVFDKGNTYKRFIEINSWFNFFIPNATIGKPSYSKKQSNIVERFLILLIRLFLLENILKFIQLKYMEKHVTRETIKEGFLGFHPFNYKFYVLRLYKKKLKNLA